MNPNSMIRPYADLFLTSRDPFATHWSTFRLPSLAPTQMAMSLAAGPDDEEPEDEDLDGEDDDEFDLDEDEDEDADDQDNDVEQTAEPDGQFPTAPDTLEDTDRPGATQNRHGDRGGVS